MIDKTILYYPPKADEPLAHNIIEKLGEPVRPSLNNNLKITNGW
jgi:hypothetical protein